MTDIRSLMLVSGKDLATGMSEQWAVYERYRCLTDTAQTNEVATENLVDTQVWAADERKKVECSTTAKTMAVASEHRAKAPTTNKRYTCCVGGWWSHIAMNVLSLLYTINEHCKNGKGNRRTVQNLSTTQKHCEMRIDGL